MNDQDNKINIFKLILLIILCILSILGSVKYMKHKYNKANKPNNVIKINKEEEPKETDKDDELSIRTNEISSKYDIDIIYGDKVPSYALFESRKTKESKAYTIKDKDVITKALDIIEESLEIYPNGFFNSLKYNNHKDNLKIYLVGENHLSKGVSYYANNFYFITLSLDNEEYIEGLSNTFNHELLHIIDFRIEYLKQINKDILFNEDDYMKYNPKGFTYNSNSYNDNTSNYFISPYGAESAPEDRATIFGTYMDYYLHNKEGLKDLLNEHIIAKLDYISLYIRDALSTEEWPSKTAWEEIR